MLFADSWSHSSHCNSGSRVENLEHIRESKSLLSDYNYNLQPERKSNRLRCGKEVTSICTEKPRALISEKGTRASEELSTSIPSSPFIIFPSTVSHPTHKVPLRITIPPLEKNLVSSSKEQVSRERESRSPDHVSELGKDSARVLHYLVVDDVMMNRRMVIRVLSSYHHRVSEATDGKDCLKVWEEITAAGGTVDVVLMDNSMPIMTGQQKRIEMNRILEPLVYSCLISLN